MRRKLIKFSNYSFCITLPKKAIDQLGWGKGEEVEVDFDSKARKITVYKKRAASKSTESVKPVPKLRF